MLQVDKAFDYLTNYANVPERNMRLEVSCGSNSRGIYLREFHQVLQPSEVVVTIEPVYMEDATGAPTDVTGRYCNWPGRSGHVAGLLKDASFRVHDIEYLVVYNWSCQATLICLKLYAEVIMVSRQPICPWDIKLYCKESKTLFTSKI